jgi:transcriptional regulator with XRE-family HTH domain
MSTLSFGERVGLLRRRKGLTQEALGQEVGITQNALSRVERGDIKMLSGTLVALLADALGTSADYLLGRVQEPDQEESMAPAGV